MSLDYNRPNGYYWVRRWPKAPMEPAEWRDDHWCFIGTDVPCYDEEEDELEVGGLCEQYVSAEINPNIMLEAGGGACPETWYVWLKNDESKEWLGTMYLRHGRFRVYWERHGKENDPEVIFSEETIGDGALDDSERENVIQAALKCLTKRLEQD